MIEWWEPHAEALQTAGVSDGIRNGCPRIWATIDLVATGNALGSVDVSQGHVIEAGLDGCIDVVGTAEGKLFVGSLGLAGGSRDELVGDGDIAL